MREGKRYGLQKLGSDGVRLNIKLEGKAAWLWQRIPKGVRSQVITRLLLEAYHMGKLDLVLEEIGEDEVVEVVVERVKGDEKVKGNDGKRGKEKREASSGVLSSKSKSSKVRKSKDKSKDKGQPQWLTELEEKINGFVRLD